MVRPIDALLNCKYHYISFSSICSKCFSENHSFTPASDVLHSNKMERACFSPGLWNFGCFWSSNELLMELNLKKPMPGGTNSCRMIFFFESHE